MRILLIAAIALLAFPAVSQAQKRDEAKREECKEEAKRAVQSSRSRKIDRDQLREMRRDYARECRGRAPRG